jgi:hypothetical protein
MSIKNFLLTDKELKEFKLLWYMKKSNCNVLEAILPLSILNMMPIFVYILRCKSTRKQIAICSDMSPFMKVKALMVADYLNAPQILKIMIFVITTQLEKGTISQKKALVRNLFR